MSDQWKYDHAQWEVLWVVRRNGENHIVGTDFERDFVGALALYSKAKKAGKKMCTLRCKNIGHAPPDRYRDLEPIYKKRKGKLVVVGERMSEPPQYTVKMEKYNRQGVWWCPYCMELRRYEKRGWSEVDDVMFSADPKYYCPICDISSSDAQVIKYNPIARRLMYGKKSRGKKKGRKRGRRK